MRRVRRWNARRERCSFKRERRRRTCHGFIKLAVIAALLSIAPLSAHAQADLLPPVDAGGLSGPLSLNQLTSEERARYNALPSGGDEARQFLYTRGFLRYSRLVIDGNLPPQDLPGLPEQENWDRQFLSAEESVVVETALHRFLLSGRTPTRSRAQPATDTMPAVDAAGMLAPLAVAQLDAAERTTYSTLAPGSHESRQFLYTRGFLRYCRLVTNGFLDPRDLPDVPEPGNWNRQFLSTDERTIVDRAVMRHLTAQ